MPPALLLLVSVLAWGLWGVLDKLSLRTLHPAQAQIVAVAVGLLTLPAYWVLLQRAGLGASWDPRGVAWAAGGGLLTWLASLTYLTALASRPASQVVAATAVYPLVTLAVAALCLGEVVTAPRALGVCLIVAGLLLLGR